MDRPLIERWTDTTAFRVALFLSGLLTVPVLGLGLIVSVVLLVVAVAEQTAELAGAVIVLLSVGGAVGFFGWLRAHQQVKRAQAQDPTATLLCLAVGTATALSVGGMLVVPAVATLATPWGSPAAALPAAVVIAAQLVWAVAGVAWMLRLNRHYRRLAGRPFDGLPVVLLLVVIVLVAAAALIATTL